MFQQIHPEQLTAALFIKMCAEVYGRNPQATKKKKKQKRAYKAESPPR